ncbi:MAG TPA: DUF3817 domain-containing protein [Candidatus Saccharimonadales bacterium]|nr:DUF3817 domain-containing protein [Candidatus Saccharimonadales bacterium]
MASLLRRFERNQIFSNDEAWLLFRIAALGEAFGWTLLIIGITLERYLLPGNYWSVLLAGRIHGTLFFLYLLATLGLYPNLHWSRGRGLAALLASVPPYGSLIFERWASYRRQRRRLQIYSRSLLCKMLADSLAA